MLVFGHANGLLFRRHPPAGVPPLDAPPALLASLDAQCGEHVRHEPARPRCARGLAELDAFKGNPERAVEWMEFYLEHRTGADPEAEQIAQSLRVTSLNNQALALESKGDWAGAEPLLRRALAIAEKALGPDHPD